MRRLESVADAGIGHHRTGAIWDMKCADLLEALPGVRTSQNPRWIIDICSKMLHFEPIQTGQDASCFASGVPWRWCGGFRIAWRGVKAVHKAH
jgi:hypothetical protein